MKGDPRPHLRDALTAVRRPDAPPDWFEWADRMLRKHWAAARQWQPAADYPSAGNWKVESFQLAATLVEAIVLSPRCPRHVALGVLRSGALEVPVAGVCRLARGDNLPAWLWDELACHRHAKVVEAVIGNSSAPDTARVTAALSR